MNKELYDCLLEIARLLVKQTELLEEISKKLGK